MKKRKNYTIIIGCGRLGANLADSLSNSGENVLVIDENKDNFKRLSSNFGGLTLTGDGTDLNKLVEANIKDATTVIAVTDDDNTNIMVAQLAKQLFETKQIIARIYDPECESIYNNLGINTICPSTLSSIEISKIVNEN